MSETRANFVEDDIRVAAMELTGGAGLNLFAVYEFVNGNRVGAIIGAVALIGSLGLYVDAARHIFRDHWDPPQDSIKE